MDRWPGAAGRAPLVCLPGFLGDRRIFEPLAEAAEGAREIIAFDLPSGAPRKAARSLAPRLAPLAPLHLLTGSYGGLVARCLPPGLLLSWATVGTLPARGLVPTAVERRSRAMAAVPAPLLERLYRRHLRRSLRRDGVPEDLALRLATRGLSKEELLRRARGVLAWDLDPLPPCPTLWILGATDPEAPWSPAQVLLSCPAVEVARVPGGHQPFATHPGPLLARLAAFWASVERRS